MIRAAMLATNRVPYAGPFGAYLQLEARRKLRDRRFLVLAAFFPIVLYLVYTAVIGKGEAQPEIDGMPWTAFFMVSMAGYGAMGAAMTWAATIALERRTGWVRQLRATPLPPVGYVLVKVLVTLLTIVPAVVLITLVGRVVNNVELPLGTWIELVLVIVLGSIPFAALAVALGYSLRPENGQPVSMLLYFGLALLGGMFAPLDSFPDAIATIGRMLPSYRLVNLGWSVLAGVPIDPADVLILAAWTVAFGALALYRYRADEQRAA
jgi:ABC-2 type transport system permease protein